MNDGEKVETQPIRGTEDRANSNPDNENGSEGVDEVGGNAQHDTTRLSGASRESRNGQNRRTIAGGMLKQLIEETIDQLQQMKQQQKKLEARLQHLTLLSEELSAKTGETITLEVSEEE